MPHRRKQVGVKAHLAYTCDRLADKLTEFQLSEAVVVYNRIFEWLCLHPIWAWVTKTRRRSRGRPKWSLTADVCWALWWPRAWSVTKLRQSVDLVTSIQPCQLLPKQDKCSTQCALVTILSLPRCPRWHECDVTDRATLMRARPPCDTTRRWSITACPCSPPQVLQNALAQNTEVEMFKYVTYRALSLSLMEGASQGTDVTGDTDAGIGYPSRL